LQVNWSLEFSVNFMLLRPPVERSVTQQTGVRVQITSENRDMILEIIRNDPSDPYSDYTMRAIARDDINSFSGQNDGVQLSGFEAFRKRFAEFIGTRQETAVLEMTEDCRLEFFRWNARGDVGVRVRIRNDGFSTDSSRVNKRVLEIEFKVDGEFVNQIYEDFTRI
jgi:hypothetical protein